MREAPVRRAPRPVLITDARPAPERELRGREIRYVAMMTLRAVCLILAVVLASLKVPLVGLWVSLCGVGMIVLPWLAVVIANDGPPKPGRRARRRQSPHAALPR